MSYVPNPVELKVLKAIASGGGTPVSHGTVYGALDVNTRGHLHFALSNMMRQKFVEASYHATEDGQEGYTGYKLTPKGEALPGVVTP